MHRSNLAHASLLVGVALLLAVASGSPVHGGDFSVQLTDEFSWYQGTEAATMGPARDRVCFLTRIQGHFDGAEEAVHARVIDGTWVLDGRARHGGVGVHARCLRLASDDLYSEAHRWEQGKEATDLGSAEDRACFLTGMQGRFEGGGEWVLVTVRDGRWILDGASQQAGVGATARCVLTDSYSEEKELKAGPGMMDMMRRVHGACFLTGLQGRMAGPEDSAAILDKQGKWQLHTQDEDRLITARARCLD
jgi:hypothetical protein